MLPSMSRHFASTNPHTNQPLLLETNPEELVMPLEQQENREAHPTTNSMETAWEVGEGRSWDGATGSWCLKWRERILKSETSSQEG